MQEAALLHCAAQLEHVIGHLLLEKNYSLRIIVQLICDLRK